MTPKKILLAEDDGDDQEFFSNFLQERKDIVLLSMVDNGEELFEYLENVNHGLPDAIILDQNMPKQNGLQTLKLLKQNNQFAHIPVVVYSTYTDENLVQRSTDFGASLVLTKPSTSEGYHKMMDELYKVI